MLGRCNGEKQQSPVRKTLKMLSSAGVSWFCSWEDDWHLIHSQDPEMDCLFRAELNLSRGWRKWFMAWSDGRIMFLRNCSKLSRATCLFHSEDLSPSGMGNALYETVSLLHLCLQTFPLTQDGISQWGVTFISSFQQGNLLKQTHVFISQLHYRIRTH